VAAGDNQPFGPAFWRTMAEAFPVLRERLPAVEASFMAYVAEVGEAAQPKRGLPRKSLYLILAAPVAALILGFSARWAYFHAKAPAAAEYIGQDYEAILVVNTANADLAFLAAALLTLAGMVLTAVWPKEQPEPDGQALRAALAEPLGYEHIRASREPFLQEEFEAVGCTPMKDRLAYYPGETLNAAVRGSSRTIHAGETFDEAIRDPNSDGGMLGFLFLRYEFDFPWAGPTVLQDRYIRFTREPAYGAIGVPGLPERYSLHASNAGAAYRVSRPEALTRIFDARKALAAYAGNLSIADGAVLAFMLVEARTPFIFAPQRHVPTEQEVASALYFYNGVETLEAALRELLEAHPANHGGAAPIDAITET